MGVYSMDSLTGLNRIERKLDKISEAYLIIDYDVIYDGVMCICLFLGMVGIGIALVY